MIYPKSTAEMTGEHALQVLRWLESNTDYLEHGGKEMDGGFWPHNNCNECGQSYHFEDEFFCIADADEFKDKTLVEYVLMRMEETP